MPTLPPSAPHLTQNWIVRKPATTGKAAIVTSQVREAADVGLAIVEDGGDAVDAAVATGFALAALEPWNSGLGGIGHMLIWRAREARAEWIDFGPVSPQNLDPAAFPLVGGAGGDLFAWPAVIGDRNVHGALSVAVPGHVAGLGLAHQRFGRLAWKDVLAPAVAIARAGMPIDWYTTLRIALFARELAFYDDTAKVWLPGGLPPVAVAEGSANRLVLGRLADTLERLGASGADDFYRGDVARELIRDVRRAGGVLSPEDLKRYRARHGAPRTYGYRDAVLHLPGRLTAAPTLATALKGLAARTLDLGAPGPATYLAYADVLSAAYAERFEKIGDISHTRDPACTTHLNVVDREGNMVALTQTLLSVFGSKLVSPSTGILMNNGIMWFDPRSGRPNSIGPAKRPLTNMCPVIATRDNRGWLAIGASGGRKILPAVAQILSFLTDYRMDLETAFHQPRVDASGEPQASVDSRLPEAVFDAIAARMPVRRVELVVLPTNYACPSAILVDGATGSRTGMTDVMSPWSGAVIERPR
ncbi:MAG TPA: gamma-glutamyltransferase [Alphaproteobacteria bacterium]|jgi:gamma-glutamyltranspeptidase/glutathione hydrolase|nr:gamma-glutamyltransferase [Alphaproteobacteria bacterium]